MIYYSHRDRLRTQDQKPAIRMQPPKASNSPAMMMMKLLQPQPGQAP
jgi:hypothetical protein